ncbi:MAG: hypothetical protein KJ915_07300 [Candidatus Omnitrophica bacterium]|nr:hypothetical protein [Candidatus Omnitrophota bacterium]
MRKVLFIIILLLFSVHAYAESLSMEDEYIEPLNSLYRQAIQSTTEVSIEAYKALNQIFTSGWTDSQVVISAINEHEKAISLFKLAALQESNQAMFIKKPEKITFIMPGVDGSKLRLLLRLVLAQGLKFESAGQYHKAKENYIASVRFIMHSSREEFKALQPQLMEMACFNIVEKCIYKSISDDNLSNGYYSDLLKYFNVIYGQQDFLESVFKTELLGTKNLARMLEKEMPDSGPYKINKIFFKKDINLFFRSFYMSYDLRVNENTKNAIECAKKNDLSLLRMEQREIEEKELGKPFNMVKKFLRKFLIERKNITQIKAEFLADIMSTLGQPDYSKIINYYHVYYNKLNLLRTALAVKLYEADKGELPDSLDFLVLEYLKEVPLDTYNEFKPLSYIKAENTVKIYSWGPDRKDDSGNAEFDKNDLSSVGDILILVDED